MNNGFIIKCKIDENLNNALKKILSKKRISQQDLIESLIKEFVLNNLDVVINDEKKEGTK